MPQPRCGTQPPHPSSLSLQGEGNVDGALPRPHSFLRDRACGGGLHAPCPCLLPSPPWRGFSPDLVVVSGGAIMIWAPEMETMPRKELQAPQLQDLQLLERHQIGKAHV